MTANRFSRELSVWADFNSRDSQGRVTTSLRFADSPMRPAVGERILLHDDEGNSVHGVVEEIHDLAIRVVPVMATWTSKDIAIEERFEGASAFRAQAQDAAINA